MSLVLGMIEQAVLFETGQTYASDAVVLVVILAALLLQRGGAVERARLTGVAAWAGQREVRPIPRELRRLPEIRIGVPVLGDDRRRRCSCSSRSGGTPAASTCSPAA